MSHAILVSHGAYADGGPVAAHAYAAVAARGGPPPVVMILGTDHRHRHVPMALASPGRHWLTPLGPVATDDAFISDLVAQGIPVDDSGHDKEHSIENQLPFLQQLN